MLNIAGLNRFSYQCNFHDLRCKNVPSRKQERAYRKVMSYKRMKADKSVCHASDLSRFLEGSAVPGTHASGDFMAHLAFNHFVLNVPSYREMYCLDDLCMSLSRMPFIYLLHKGAAFTSKLVNNLKNLVNKECKIAICMTHARAKSVYAFEQSADMDAKYFLTVSTTILLSVLSVPMEKFAVKLLKCTFP